MARKKLTDEEKKDRKRKRDRKYREKNREQINERNRKRYKANPEYQRESNSKWCKANPEKKREWRKTNSEYQRKYQHEWCKANRPKKNAIGAKRRACKAGAIPIVDCPRVKDKYAIAAWLRSMGDDVHVDHIIPLAKGGEHAWWNLQILSASDNLSKGAKMPGTKETFRRAHDS